MDRWDEEAVQLDGIPPIRSKVSSGNSGQQRMLAKIRDRRRQQQRAISETGSSIASSNLNEDEDSLEFSEWVSSNNQRQQQTRRHDKLEPLDASFSMEDQNTTLSSTDMSVMQHDGKKQINFNTDVNLSYFDTIENDNHNSRAAGNKHYSAFGRTINSRSVAATASNNHSGYASKHKRSASVNTNNQHGQARSKLFSPIASAKSQTSPGKSYVLFNMFNALHSFLHIVLHIQTAHLHLQAGILAFMYSQKFQNTMPHKINSVNLPNHSTLRCFSRIKIQKSLELHRLQDMTSQEVHLLKKVMKLVRNL